MAMMLKVNGQPHEVDVEPGTPLLWVIRDELRMTGTKYGCGVASCGACTVHLDGEPVRSCQTYVEDVAHDGNGNGADITTIEAVADTEVGDAVRQAWIELDVVQCGYCQSGQIMSAVGLLTENRQPDVEEIDSYMYGNVCRCAAYQRIRAGIRRASEILEA